MAIYAIGEGWTGALTQRYARDSIGGHFDEETFDEPVMIYPHDDILHADAGWGCSAFLNTQGQVQLVGRPQDLMALLRMNRMPAFMRQWVSSNSDPSQTNILGRIVSKNVVLWRLPFRKVRTIFALLFDDFAKTPLRRLFKYFILSLL